MNSRNQSTESLRSELCQLVHQMKPSLPTLGDYGLPREHKAALHEVDQLLSDALKPNDHGERAELLYLKAWLFVQIGKQSGAATARRACASEATRAFFGSKEHSLWLELRWHRVKQLGEQKHWLAFERALSEMIGWLASSSRTDGGRDISIARYARGLCYQLRGLESGDPEVTSTFYSSSLL